MKRPLTSHILCGTKQSKLGSVSFYSDDALNLHNIVVFLQTTVPQWYYEDLLKSWRFLAFDASIVISTGSLHTYSESWHPI
jgi:hypothetical protein